ncbi:MAG: M14 family metallopeptidase [bacterium]|nr:M14 family metallopeptidase [bacterium]
MIETVCAVEMPVDENLEIKRHRLLPDRTLTGGEKRISIVTGTHGNELEGQYVCYELTKRIMENRDKLNGIVDIYPALNPLGIDSITRGIPGFDLDMNRVFPGSEDGSMVEHIASRIIESLSGSDMVLDIHASNIFLREIPQARISDITAQKLLPYAKLLNLDFIWIHSAATVLEATLAHSLNISGTPTIVVEMGVGMRLTSEYCSQLTDGIFALMKEMGIWKGEAIVPREPILSGEQSVSYINAGKSGIFVPRVEHWKDVRKGSHIGDIVDPLQGIVLEAISSPCDGVVFTLREYPVVDEGSLIARILERGDS